MAQQSNRTVAKIASPSGFESAVSDKSSTLRKGFESDSRALAEQKFREYLEETTMNFRSILQFKEAFDRMKFEKKGLSSINFNVGGETVNFTSKDFSYLLKNFEREIKDIAALQKTVKKTRTVTKRAGPDVLYFFNSFGNILGANGRGAYDNNINQANFETENALKLFFTQSGLNFGVKINSLPTLSNNGVAYSGTLRDLYTLARKLNSENALGAALMKYFNDANYPPLIDRVDSKTSYYVPLFYADEEAKYGDVTIFNIIKAKDQNKLSGAVALRKKPDANGVRQPRKVADNTWYPGKVVQPIKFNSVIAAHALTLGKAQEYQNMGGVPNQVANYTNVGANIEYLQNVAAALSDPDIIAGADRERNLVKTQLNTLRTQQPNLFKTKTSKKGSTA